MTTMHSLGNLLGAALTAIIVLGMGLATKAADATNQARIAVVVSGLNSSWFAGLANTARERAAALGYETTVYDSQYDAGREAGHLDSAMAGGCAAILLNPTDTRASVAGVRRARTNGVPVFCFDRELAATDAAISQVVSDNHAGGRAIGKCFVELVGESGEYGELLGMVGEGNTYDRSKGFHDVVDGYPGLKLVVQQNADFDRAKGREAMAAMLQGHPAIKAVFCGNDTMALGAYEALAAAGKAGQVKVFGFDGAAEALRSISEGRIEATVMQFPGTVARTAADFAAEYLKGRRDFPPRVPVAVELVTRANVEKYLNLGK
jgi:ribose transport system substrate-binding protein